MHFIEDFFSPNPIREPNGYMSWQHLTAVTISLLIAVFASIYLSKKTKENPKAQMKVIKVTAILLVGTELIRDLVISLMAGSWTSLLGSLPLFLCGIPVIILPFAAFAKGRLQKAALDCVLMFGLLGGVLGTYMAANIFGAFPVLHFDPLTSIITHYLAAFASLFIGFTRLATLEKRNIGLTIAILGAFMGTALLVNTLHHGRGFQDNYMFLSRSDGTPFMILENWFGPMTFGYTLSVALTMWVYMLGFYGVYYLFIAKRTNKTVIKKA